MTHAWMALHFAIHFYWRPISIFADYESNKNHKKSTTQIKKKTAEGAIFIENATDNQEDPFATEDCDQRLKSI